MQAEAGQLVTRHPSLATGAKHLYLHIPFCLQICPYCSFYKDIAGPGKAEPLVEAILREAELFGANCVPETVFIGGGTPTALSVSLRSFSSKRMS